MLSSERVRGEVVVQVTETPERPFRRPARAGSRTTPRASGLARAAALGITAMDRRPHGQRGPQGTLASVSASRVPVIFV